MKIFCASENPSFLRRCPALLMLAGIVLSLALAQRGLVSGAAVAASVLFTAAQILLCEDCWSFRHAVLAAAVLLGTAFFSCMILWRTKPDMTLPRTCRGAYLVTLRRQWGESELLLLRDSRGVLWTASPAPEIADMREGDRFYAEATPRPFPLVSAQSSFSPAQYWKAKGAAAQLKGIRNVKRLGAPMSLHTFRQWLRSRLSLLPQDVRDVAAAILLGDRDRNLQENFQRWGISHILAVSGWHVGLCLTIGWFFVRNRSRGVLWCSLLLWSYCLLSGSSVSTVRAAVMLQILIISRILGRAHSSLNALAWAAVVMLLWNPGVFQDVGWQLSVMIAMAVSSFHKMRKLWIPLVSPVLLWLIASPLTAPNSGGILFSSLAINIMAGAFFPLFLPGVAAAALCAVLGLRADIFFLGLQRALDLWSAAAEQWVEWLPLGLPVQYFPAWGCAAIFVLCIALGEGFAWKRALPLSMMWGGAVLLFQ